MWSHARAPLRKDGKSVCTAICKWFIFKSVWPKVEQNRPIKQSKIKYDLVFMDWMDWCSYNRSRYEVSRMDAKPRINLMVLKGNCLATLARRTFPAIWMKIEKYVLVFMPIFKLLFPKKNLIPYSSDLHQTVSPVWYWFEFRYVRTGLKTATVLGRNKTRQLKVGMARNIIF